MTLRAKNIIIIGASGHAKVVIDIVEKQKMFNIIGLIDSYKKVGTKISGYKILGTEDIIEQLMADQEVIGGIIAIGDNWTRHLIKEKIKKTTPNFEFLSAIHPNAVLSKNIKIPKGTVIMAGAIINSDAIVGEFCIINTNASLGHESTMQNYSSLAPGVNIGGNVNIGDFSAISIGATIIQNINIGDHALVGAGALVINDVKDCDVVYGVPAKHIRTRNIDEKYLHKYE
ncbi:acetyltransferase [Mariniflexile sp. HMF6888]|uniref:acetyltransferase n=1 Tax=Mariniflexile sp. HMF6888 TaxID=3373086 RepID=UPI0037A2808C